MNARSTKKAAKKAAQVPASVGAFRAIVQASKDCSKAFGRLGECLEELMAARHKHKQEATTNDSNES